MPKTFELSRKILINGAERTSIELREPSFGEIDDYGMIANQDGALDFKALKNWIGRLAKVDGAAVRAIPPKDIMLMAKWIAEEMTPEEVSEKNLDSPPNA